MCFVSYVPLAGGGYLMGSNRDESINRAPANEPAQVNWGRLAGLAPQDGKAHGTWIGTRQDGCTIVLLNGAQHKHNHHPPYRHSRGLIIPKLMHHKNLTQGWDQLLLEKIEPFTLVIADGKNLWQAQWDGSHKYFTSLPYDKPYCWSSATLYNSWEVAARAKWFFQQLEKRPIRQSLDLLQFHTNSYGPKDYDIMMERINSLGVTVSSTVVDFSQTLPTMYYIDHLKKRDFTLKLNILPAYAGDL